MILDSSAVIALLFDEPGAQDLLQAIQNDPQRMMSSASALEALMVAVGRAGDSATYRLDALLADMEIEIVAFDADQLRAARDAFFRFGKGRHPARLNFGDCITYALAKTSGQPLLFKGDDFSKTDIETVDAAGRKSWGLNEG